MPWLNGTIEVWHRWDDEAGQAALNQIARDFMALCPAITIELSAAEREELGAKFPQIPLLRHTCYVDE